MSGKIITRVRERERAALDRQQRYHVVVVPDDFLRRPEPLMIRLVDYVPPSVYWWNMLKNWRQWFFKDGRDGGM